MTPEIAKLVAAELDRATTEYRQTRDVARETRRALRECDDRIRALMSAWYAELSGQDLSKPFRFPGPRP